jgi:hypothetical protein
LGFVAAIGLGLLVGPVIGIAGGLKVITDSPRPGHRPGSGHRMILNRSRLEASAIYVATVFRLWRAGRLPRRLMPFLEEAHERGVLRQAGQVFQFRHGFLQHRLARSYAVTIGDGTHAGPGES